MQFAGRNFLSMPAPPGYKAGVGRGAVGFSTTAERGGGDDAFPRRPPDRGRNQSKEGNGDRFLDSGSSSVSVSRSLRENAEAEAVYAAIDAKLTSKRSKKRSQAIDTNNPLKTHLNEISVEEWANIPEASDLTHRNKRLREEERSLKRNYAVPDSLILAQQDEEQRLAELHRKRIMLESMIKAEPHNPEGFLSLARLEQQAGRHKKARLIIEKGSLMCPQSPDIWLESISLHPNSAEARVVVAKACRACPDNEQLWLRAVDLEPTSAMKAHVAHEALLHCSSSAQLWLLAADLEEDSSAKEQVLRTAVEFLPSHEQLWLALIDVSGNQRNSVIAEARKQCPSSIQIWLLLARSSAAADLDGIVKEAVEGDDIPHSELLETLYSLRVPDDEPLIQSLVKFLAIRMADLSKAPTSQNTRDFIFASLPKSEELFLEWAKTNQSILEEAVNMFPYSNSLWREYISAGGDVELILQKKGDLTDELLVVAVDNLLLRGDLETSIKILGPRKNSPQSVALLAECYDYSDKMDEAAKTVADGIMQWPESAELYLARANLDPMDVVTAHLKDALKRVSTENELRPLLWRELARSLGSAIARRATLSQAIAEFPRSGDLWLERVLLEKKEKGPISQVLSDALRQCPKCGLIWWEAILATPENQRKKKLVEAVKSSEGDIYVLIAGGLLFISAGKRDKAKEWFMRAHAKDPNNGDVVLWMYKYGFEDGLVVDGRNIRSGPIWLKDYRRSLALGKPVVDVLSEVASTLVNPFSADN